MQLPHIVGVVVFLGLVIALAVVFTKHKEKPENLKATYRPLNYKATYDKEAFVGELSEDEVQKRLELRKSAAKENQEANKLPLRASEEVQPGTLKRPDIGYVRISTPLNPLNAKRKTPLAKYK